MHLPRERDHTDLAQLQAAIEAAMAPLPQDRYLNRELSWLDFNSRVLALASDARIPLLERVKFLAIFATNLDEFFMVRVAGLQRREETGLQVRSADGLTAREQIARIMKRAQEISLWHSNVYHNIVLPELEAQRIHIVRWNSLQPHEHAALTDFFITKIFPLLTPLAVDPGHPFPYISGLSLNLAVTIRDMQGHEQFARVKVPDNVPRFVRIEEKTDNEKNTPTPAEKDAHVRFIALEDVIAAHLSYLFEGMVVVDHHVFRVTRNADFEVDEDRDENLLKALEREIARRRFGAPVRLEVSDDMTDVMLAILIRELDVKEHSVVTVPGQLDLSSLMQLTSLERPSLKDAPFVPKTHPAFADGEVEKSIFETLQEGDILVHHPYQSFSTTVQRFIEQAAADPDVLAIKQTLYRTSGDSPIVDALISAAEDGKQVAALVEIKARFDEVANIKWARKLEQAGVHVVYGLVGLKTHCKTCLVVRREGNTLRRYCHIGTGNYNPKTARLYEDVGYLSASEDLGADLTDLFNTLTGYSQKKKYRRILAAPHRIRDGLIEKIYQEIEHHKRDQSASIDIKANALVDEKIIDALYRASQSGVRVRCLIRGICALRPGIPDLSENITVHSILGRFLEHSRVFHFGAINEYWIGSADIMHRNLDRRVEVIAQVRDPRLTAQIARIFRFGFDPEIRCWQLQPEGTWSESTGDPNAEDYQQVLQRYYGN